MVKGRVANARYTKEFREERVKLITEGGLKISEVGRRLSIAASTIAYWVKAHKAGKLNEVGKKQLRSLRRSRCPVRDNKTDGTPIFSVSVMPIFECIHKWLL